MMGSEIRMVTKDWKHPRNYGGKYDPLRYNYVEDIQNFKDRVESHGIEDALDYWGGGPVKDDYMLADTPAEECTFLMMYETTSEGTPISPAFETPEELARWLVDNKASSFGGMTATYEAWLATCKRGWAISAVYDPAHGFRSGVEALVTND